MRLSKSLRGLFASLPPLQVKVFQSKTVFHVFATISSSQEGLQRVCDNVVQARRVSTRLRHGCQSKMGLRLGQGRHKEMGFHVFAARSTKQDGFPFDIGRQSISALHELDLAMP